MWHNTPLEIARAVYVAKPRTCAVYPRWVRALRTRAVYPPALLAVSTCVRACARAIHTRQTAAYGTVGTGEARAAPPCLSISLRVLSLRGLLTLFLVKSRSIEFMIVVKMA